MAEAVADDQLPMAQDERSPAAVGPASRMAANVVTPQSWREAPIARQFSVVVALAAAVAIGVAVALWSQAPDHVPLFSDLSAEDQGKISELLQLSGSEFSIDSKTGAILVPAEQRTRLRMQMAQQGLPSAKSVGLEMLQETQDLSTSQFVEGVRYQHALETELARSISSLNPVRAARVHLALPKQSIFVRQRRKPTASVVIALHPGRSLERAQVEAIVHMVASSIPHLLASQVSVVDHMGRLLTDGEDGDGMAASGKQFDYTKRLERDYSERIVHLLEPVVGFGRVRAQVTADLDFDRSEQSSETFDPARQVLRSEQVREDESRNGDIAGGIPGALSNQPPGAGTTDEGSAAENPDEASTSQQSRSATRNYEVDKTVSHTQKSSGSIRRLAVAVIVDDKLVRQLASATPSAPAATADGQQKQAASAQAEAGTTAEAAPAVSSRQPYSEVELARLTALVKEAIGFSTARGDTVQVINASFLQPEIEALPELAIWEQLWFQSLVKQVLAGIFILLLLLLIVRPIIRGLIPSNPAEADDKDEDGAKADAKAEGALDGDASALEGQLSEGEIQWDANGRPIDPMADAARMQFDKKLDYARLLVDEDAARAANVLKNWMNEEAAG